MESTDPDSTDASEFDASDTDLSAAAVDCLCGAAGVLDLVSRKYAIPVLCALHARGTARFGDFEELLSDASTSTLSARLDELVDAGLATRTQYDEIPPRVEYELTDDGRELGERLRPLVEWAVERDG